MADIRKQIKKGLLEIAVLDLLLEDDSYGYVIIQKLKEYSDGIFDLKEGTLYPILYRLEDSKYIESYWKTMNELRSKPRKYYKITNEGRKVFSEILEDYNFITGGLNSILNRRKEGKGV
ncbi:PadR family transcriptional regulator [Mariniplasma anaerobium]|uniref:PadR family transcriptional regulator n=1 Tax=Mariniplasma anaerobium TaxID=2735436 RepID=A0A7U9THA2_9MOLU|nr:PadR family transcriptional regulator [Mariniplasma anaerobium]BCR35217.1 PadR family transcriptional regulator [Mariniplasma anaerobium]